MPKESEHFKCPCCGQHSPVERLTKHGPFTLELWHKTLGGKQALTEEQRESRKGGIPTLGSAPGLLNYEEMEVTDELIEAFKRRIAEVEPELYRPNPDST